jgi:hypothetical protein
VQVAVDTHRHLIVTHEVTNVGNDSAQLPRIVTQAKATLATDALDVVADRGYFSSEETLACDAAGSITLTLPKPQTSNNRLRKAVRQAGLPLGGAGLRLHLPERRKARLPLYE